MVTHWLDRLRRELSPLSDSALLDAQVLLAHVLERPRAWVLAHPQAALSAGQENRLETALECLKNGAPLAHVLGRWEFYGLEFKLTADTLIPRPETEMLVEQALDWLRAHPGRRSAVDVGTGSGCIAVALAVHIADLRMLVTDISFPALKVARENVLRHRVAERVSCLCCDLLGSLDQRFDLVCANLPYIPRGEMQELEVARREPLQALDGGIDGLALIGRLLAAAPQILTPGGLLLLEIGADQGPRAQLLAQTVFPGADVRVLPDLAGRDRVLRVATVG
jgi:release factor glutamine methyltransferase